MRIKGLLVISLIQLLFLSCESDNQFTKILDASPFVAELYGDSTKTVSINMDNTTDISWIGLEHNADYSYFEILEVTVGSETEEGTGPTSVFEDLSFSKTSSSRVVYLKIKYSPQKAISKLGTDYVPHEASLLLVANDGSKVGTVKVRLFGYTDGVCDSEVEECNFTSTAALTPINYTLVNNQLTIYMCHPELEAFANDSLGRDFVREDLVTIENFFVFYEDQDDIIHIVRKDDEGLDPSIPDFGAPVPEGALTVDLTSLTVSMDDVQNVSCGTDEQGKLECLDIGISIMGQVSLDFTAATGTITPTTDECDDFGSVSGSGNVGNSSIQLVGWAEMPDNILKQFVGALVVVVAPLELVTN